MRRGVAAISAVLAILLGCMPAYAWNASGHMMVDEIAYSRLNKHAKAEADRLLAISIAPAEITARSPDFVNAGHWADDIRPDPAFNTNEYKDRHFIDIPFSSDGTAIPTDLPFPNNVATALDKYVAVLKDTSASDADKAQALRFILHFVGDIHMPLHGSSRISAAHPKGDLGGNLFLIQTADARGGGAERKSNLHRFWDSGLGTFPEGGANYGPPEITAVETAVGPIKKKFTSDDLTWAKGGPYNYMDWAKESFELSKTAVYPGLTENAVVPSSYIDSNVPVAQKRIAWAGYRLAALLNAIWRPKATD